MEEKKNFTNNDLFYFYNDYETKNPMIIMFLMVITLGFYFIYWIYQTNEKLSQIDDETPHPQRGIIILLFLPLIWTIINLIFKYLIFRENIGIVKGIEITGWAFVIFLSMQYLYEFCVSFGRVTKSSGLLWYVFLYLGYFSVVLLLFDFYYTIPFIIFPLFTIPAMQGYINNFGMKVILKNTDYIFNSKHRTR